MTQRKPSLFEGAIVGAGSIGAFGAAFGGWWSALIGIVFGAAWGAWWMRRGQWVVADRDPAQGPYRSPGDAVSACCCTATPCPCACHAPPKEPSMLFSPLRPVRRFFWHMLFEPIEDISMDDAAGLWPVLFQSFAASVIAAIPGGIAEYFMHYDFLTVRSAFAAVPVYWVFRAWFRSALHLNDAPVLARWKTRIYDR